MIKSTGPEASFCELRWTSPVVSLGRGEVRFCCRSRARRVSESELLQNGKATFLNSPYELDRRKEMLKGIRHQDCASCWQIEDVGAWSPRVSTDAFRRFTPQVNDPAHLEVMLGNTCDMKCIYCSHHYSSKWAQERLEFGEFTPQQMKKEISPAPPSFEKYFWESFEDEMLPSLKSINLIGGEPLINHRFYQFIDKLEAFQPSREIVLSVVTNLNCPKTQLENFLRQTELLSQNYRLQIQVSMESFGERAEYIRYGLNWERWKNNMEKLCSKARDRFELHIQMAHNVISLTSLFPLLEYVVELQKKFQIPISLHHNMVSTPVFLSPHMLPESFNETVRHAAYFLHKQNLEAGGLWGLRDSLRSGVGARTPQHVRTQFYSFIQRNDQRRGHRFLNIFPEYADFLRSCAPI